MYQEMEWLFRVVPIVSPTQDGMHLGCTYEALFGKQGLSFDLVQSQPHTCAIQSFEIYSMILNSIGK